MAERPPEQERARKDAEEILRWPGRNDALFPLARAYLDLLAAYEDRSKAFEWAAAALDEVHEFLCGCDEPGRSDKCVAQPTATFAVLAALFPAGAEAEQHARAEHLREAREVEQHQEEKHG